jgi:hypothetical protein
MTPEAPSAAVTYELQVTGPVSCCEAATAVLS